MDAGRSRGQGLAGVQSDPAERPPAALSRRRFIRLLLGFSASSTVVLVLAPVAGFLMPGKSPSNQAGRVLAGTIQSIVPGTGKVVTLGPRPVIVCNGPTGIKAFSAVCTHLGCIVAYDAAQSPDIVSPCHGGHFSVVNGSVLAGPPPTPLKEFQVSIEKDDVYVQDA